MLLMSLLYLTQRVCRSLSPSSFIILKKKKPQNTNNQTINPFNSIGSMQPILILSIQKCTNTKFDVYVLILQHLLMCIYNKYNNPLNISNDGASACFVFFCAFSYSILLFFIVQRFRVYVNKSRYISTTIL